MRRATTVAVVAILAVLLVVAVFGASTGGHDLSEKWISDTSRDNRVNHHPVAVAEPALVVAPVAAVGGAAKYEPTSCALVRLGPADGAVEWRHGIDPANCTSHAITGPTVADLDADGGREIAFASTERALHVVDAGDGEETWRVPLDTYGYGPPVVADLVGDGRPEIVVVDIGGSVSLVADRSVRWQRDLGGSAWAPPIVSDVTADGRPEIVVGTSDGVVVLDTAGERVWTADSGAVDTGFVAGSPPLVIAAATGVIAALDGRTGDTVWTHTGSWSAVVGDVSRTERGATVFAGLSGGRIVALDASTGDRRWTTLLLPDSQRFVTPEPVLGDVDGDGDREVVAVTGTGTVAVLDAGSGRELASYDRDVPILTHATVGDVGGDGRAEIFVRYGDGRVVSLQYR